MTYEFTKNSNPLYIHNNLDNFHKNLYGNIDYIDNIGKKILELSIKLQKEKEKYIYEYLELPEGKWQEIGTKLYMVIGLDGNKIIENKLQFFLEAFVDFLKNEMLQGLKFSRDKQVTEFRENNTENFIEIVKNYINIYNNPVEAFTKWYNNSKFYKEGVLTKEDISGMQQIFDNYRLKEKDDKILKQGGGPLDSNGYLDDNIILNSFAKSERLLSKSQGLFSNIVGDIAEKGTVSFVNSNLNNFKIFGTSYWTNNEKGFTEEDLKEGNKKYYLEYQKYINNILNQDGIKLSTDDGNFSFEINNLTKNLKADEIFNIEIKIRSEKRTIPYGISSKASWGESVTNPKLHSGSLNSAFENMFKIFPEGIRYTGEIVRFLQYSIINSLGVSMKQSTEYKFEDYSKIKTLLFKIIQYYGYQWLTGGVSEFTHADFFSVYKQGHHYFIPMSIILEGLFNTDIITNNLIPPETAEITVEQLKIISKDKEDNKIDEMRSIATKVLNAGKGEIYANWNKIQKLI